MQTLSHGRIAGGSVTRAFVFVVGILVSLAALSAVAAIVYALAWAIK